VFLEDLRCDGGAHGGCQARCRLFWKVQWLKRVTPSVVEAGPVGRAAEHPAGCSETALRAAATSRLSTGEIRYYCQATEHWAATEPLRPLALWHFVADVRTGNTTIGHLLKVVGLHLVWRLRHLPRGWRLSLRLYAALHRLIMGRPDPFRGGAIPDGVPTPEVTLDLEAGEWVEVKSHDEILQTINGSQQNRGLKYNAELTPACGRRFRVAQRVSRIIDERSGRMITMKNPCITLEGVYCQALYTGYSLLCSRRVTPFFREAWLRRVGPTARRGD
jgi:hypothetical protein